MQKNTKQSGFTLVELAIVLVIIGLIVGGVLVGQDLIKAATLRAATAQIDRYDAAANTFRNKYNSLPGDLPSPNNFFPDQDIGATADGSDGMGDGDGLVEGISNASTPCNTTSSGCISGEAAVFWTELALAGLISEPITNYDAASLTLVPSDSLLPQTKLGKGGRVNVAAVAGRNYYVIGNPGTSALSAGGSTTTWTAGVSGIDSYNLDTKMDDGSPITGKLISLDQALPIANTPGGGGTLDNSGAICFDNTTTPPHYSTGNFADIVECTIAIRTSF